MDQQPSNQNQTNKEAQSNKNKEQTKNKPSTKITDITGNEFDEYDPVDDLLPDLGNLTVDEILTRDDPPKELYLRDDDTKDSENIEIPDDVDEDTVYMIHYGDRIDELNEDDKNFDIYRHFGVPSDLNDEDSKTWLEAQIPDRG